MTGTPELPPLSLVRRHDTVRLIPTRYVEQEDSVLADLVDNDADAQAILDLGNATSARLVAQAGRDFGPGRIGPDELISGVPHFRVVNAAFTYAHPEGSRFNGPLRGAWYCAFDRTTALAEVVFHKTREYAEIDRFEDQVSYQAFLADFSQQFHDLRGQQAFSDCLDPDSYVASQALAARLLDLGSVGIVFPSVRRPRGINLACFRPAAVGNVRQGEVCELTWHGSPTPTHRWRPALSGA